MPKVEPEAIINTSHKTREKMIIKNASLVSAPGEKPLYARDLRLELDGEKTEDVTYSSISLAIYLPGLLDRLGEKGRKELQKAVQAYRKDIKDIV